MVIVVGYAKLTSLLGSEHTAQVHGGLRPGWELLGRGVWSVYRNLGQELPATSTDSELSQL